MIAAEPAALALAALSSALAFVSAVGFARFCLPHTARESSNMQCLMILVKPTEAYSSSAKGLVKTGTITAEGRENILLGHRKRH
jgi:hypothetical protein